MLAKNIVVLQTEGTGANGLVLSIHDIDIMGYNLTRALERGGADSALPSCFFVNIFRSIRSIALIFSIPAQKLTAHLLVQKLKTLRLWEVYF